MARIRIILEDNDGRERAGPKPRVYELGQGLDYLHESHPLHLNASAL
jgi:hypothetical protein